MIHGFDLESPLVCEGVIGDGCGGDRIFFIQDATLKVYDKNTEERIVLITDLPNSQKIYKKACIIFIESQEGLIEFDLSSLKR